MVYRGASAERAEVRGVRFHKGGASCCVDPSAGLQSPDQVSDCATGRVPRHGCDASVAANRYEDSNLRLPRGVAHSSGSGRLRKGYRKLIRPRGTLHVRRGHLLCEHVKATHLSDEK